MLLRDLRVDAEWRDLLRPQTTEETQAMRDSIDAHGWLSPIIVVALPDKGEPVFEGQGCVCDGHNRLHEWKRRQAEWLALPTGILGRRAVPEPPKPDFILKKFPSREAVRQFIIDNQTGRRNMTPNELALLLGHAVQEAVAAGEPKKEAVARIAAENGVSEKTALRGEAFADAVDTLSPLVAQVTGARLPDIVKSEDGPAQQQVVEARKLWDSEREAAEWAGCDDLNNWPSADGRPIKEVVVEQAIKPRSKRRLDSASLASGTPVWQRKLQGFEKVLDRIWEQAPPAERQTITRHVSLVLKRYFARAKPGQDSVSKPEIPQKIMGTPLAEYAQQEAQSC